MKYVPSLLRNIINYKPLSTPFVSAVLTRLAY